MSSTRAASWMARSIRENCLFDEGLALPRSLVNRGDLKLEIVDDEVLVSPARVKLVVNIPFALRELGIAVPSPLGTEELILRVRTVSRFIHCPPFPAT